MARSESSSVTMSFPGLASFAGRDGDRTVVWLRGEHDLSTTVALADTLARAIALDYADLVIDLSDVQFMGAETVGIIVRAHELLGKQSRSMTLRAPSRCARRVLELCSVTGDLDLEVEDTAPGAPAAHALDSWVAIPVADRVEVPGVTARSARRVAVPAHAVLEPSSVDGPEHTEAVADLSKLSDLGGL